MIGEGSIATYVPHQMPAGTLYIPTNTVTLVTQPYRGNGGPELLTVSVSNRPSYWQCKSGCS